jgi:hypothetical protein
LDGTGVNWPWIIFEFHAACNLLRLKSPFPGADNTVVIAANRQGDGLGAQAAAGMKFGSLQAKP